MLSGLSLERHVPFQWLFFASYKAYIIPPFHAPNSFPHFLPIRLCSFFTNVGCGRSSSLFGLGAEFLNIFCRTFLSFPFRPLFPSLVSWLPSTNQGQSLPHKEFHMHQSTSTQDGPFMAADSLSVRLLVMPKHIASTATSRVTRPRCLRCHQLFLLT